MPSTPASPDLAALEAACPGLALPAGAAPDLPATHPGGEALPAPHTLLCEDGTPLAARWYEPPTPARAVALVSPATGVPQRYYRHFAAWLARRGYAVLTYDYRGIGESLRGPVRADRSRMRDWALLDMSTALAEAERRRAPRGLPLLVVGHSFGGNAAGLARGFERADALLTLGAQSGDWRNWPGRHRWVTGAYFHLMLPLVSHLFGRAPGWALGGRGDGLPKQVALEWARWGRRRGYLFTDPSLAAHLQGYRRFAGTAHLWNVSDDLTYGPAPAVDALAAEYQAARVRRHELVPKKLGITQLGHFGAFRPGVGEKVWPVLLTAIERDAPALSIALAQR
ncbi:MAG: alpha/beta hydrolase [Burkholderiales bacterium]|nr:alpha/beta hydrolase [Burkholderiales bacterium]